LFPGEAMIVHAEQAPEQAIGRTELSQWGAVREEALRLVEFTLNLKTRPGAHPGEIVFSSGYPILRAVNHSTGEVFAPPPGQPTFDLCVKFRSPEDRISVYAQQASGALPRLKKGRNAIALAAQDAQGTATLTAEWESAPQGLVAPVIQARLIDAAPTFDLQPTPGADLVWWQISADQDFALVPPNFDSVGAPAARLALDPLTATFCHGDQPYFFRAKARRDGVWGEWSPPLEFRVSKPARPAPAQVTVAGSRLRLSWPSAGEGCEYLVFGSNRLDFIPEPLAETEIVTLRNQGIEQSRPNKNLIATVTAPEIELEPTCRFYRIVTRKDGRLSVPGDLLVTPPALAQKLPPATVLQDRWKHTGDSDQHLATETPLP
jgi:hypothetical protein